MARIDRPGDKRNRKVKLRGADFDEAVSPRAIPGDPGYIFAPGDSPEDIEPEPRKRKRGNRGGRRSRARRRARRAAMRRDPN